MKTATEHRPRVLIVDDEQTNIRLLATALHDRYAVSIALNGEQALEAARAARPPNIILLDVRMPGIDGFEVCESLKSDPLTAPIPVIFVTGLDDSDSEERGLRAGCVDYVQKPISPAVVRLRVQLHLERQQHADALAESEKRFKDFATAASDWLWESDHEHRCTLISEHGDSGSVRQWSEASGQSLLHLVQFGADSEATRRLREAIEAHQPFRDIELKRQTSTGERWILASGVPNFDPDGQFVGYRGTAAEITAMVETRSRAESAQRRMISAIESFSEGFALYRADGQLVVCNDRYKQLMPELRDFIRPEMSFESLIRKRLELGMIADAVGDEEQWLARRLEHFRNPREPLEIRESNDRWLQIHEARTPEGEVLVIVIDVTERRKIEQESREREAQLRLAYADISEANFKLEREIAERKAYADKLHQLANYDALTRLPNRQLLLDRLDHGVRKAQRSGEGLAVVFIDLDHFKLVNDGLGHSAGDALLKEVSRRLQSCVRDSDTVARWGGDEFVIVLDTLREPGRTELVAARIRKVMEENVDLDGQAFFVNMSIGISQCPHDGTDPASLLQNANIAMHRVKHQGRNALGYYTESMDSGAGERLTVEAELHRALERGELSLVYQPQIDLGSGAVVGVEALARWANPRLGELPPDEFIPMAEEKGLILPIGEWVLTTACEQFKNWLDRGIAPPQLAVNLSPRQFLEADLAERVSTILEQTQLPAASLQLELTESMLMHDVERAVGTLQALSGFGVQIAIDDFGTGYSSLSHLKRFPLDWLKIDRTFVRDLHSDPDNAAIVSAVIALAHSIDLKVIAEGIETDAQLDFLCQRHCDAAQGYLISLPLAADDTSSWLTNLHQTGPWCNDNRPS